MNRYDVIEEITKSKKIKKFNDKHDKLGRFASKDGGSAFTPANSVDEATKFARKELGFSGYVDYSYSYIDKTSGLQVSGYLDIDTINSINNSIKQIQDRYPEMKGKVKNLECTSDKVYAQIHYDGRSGDASLRIGAVAYKDGMDSVYASYAEDVSKGYHPKGTTGEAIIWHEYGHVYAGMSNKQSAGMYASTSNVLRAINMGVSESGWKNEATKKLMSDPKLKMEYEMLGLEYSAPKIAASYGAKVSKYATHNDSELFAEAFAAHNTGHGTRWTDALIEAAGADRSK